MGGQMMVEFMGGPFDKRTATIQNQMAKGLSWFRQHNAEAYMVLLD
jgi:poly-beta-hydroxyalkanoate depolymerase